MNNFKIYIDNFQNSLKNIEDYIYCLEIEKKAIKVYNRYIKKAIIYGGL